MTRSIFFIGALLLCFQANFDVKAQNSAPTTAISAERFNSRLDHVLTLEIAAQLSGFDASKATKEYENKTAQAFGKEAKPPRECNYWWSNSRTRSMTVGDQTMQIPYKDKVGLSRFSNTTLERFKRNYSALTDAQKDAAAKQLETESAAKGATTDADKKVTETGNQLITSHQAEEVSGIGEAATWYVNTNELRVFHKGLTFAVAVDISDDNSFNKRKAIELASIIIKENLL